MLPEIDKTALIILGSDSFPLATQFTSSKAFLYAKESIKNYFIDDFHIDPATRILDLFGEDMEQNEMDDAIYAFINTLPDLQNLFIYYIGHGSFAASNGDFLLTIKRSKSRNLESSSIRAKSLGQTLINTTLQFRTFMILDCCFSAEMFKSFQSPVDQIIKVQIGTSFPKNGLALLCSTSRDAASIIVEKRNTTMFSEGLIKALRQGTPVVKEEYLSLRQLGTAAYRYIKADNPENAVQPEVHTPYMPAGDIADIPLFKNADYKGTGTDIAFDIDTRKKIIEKRILDNDFINAGRQFMAFVNDFITGTQKDISDLPDALEEPSITRDQQQKFYEAMQRIMNDRYSTNTATTERKKKDSDELKHFYLNKKPDEKSVFICNGVTRRISPAFSITDFSLNLKLGEITAVVGENGNGKTTVLRIVAGELKPSSGRLEYPYFDQKKMSWIDIKSCIGYVKETLSSPGQFNSLRQQLQYTAAIKGITGKENNKRLDNIMTMLRLRKEQHKPWPALSRGFKLRFEIARELIAEPRLLILDEPLANLDVKTQLSFLDDLKNLITTISHHTAVLISSQNLYEIERIADNLVFLKEGESLYNGKSHAIGANNTYRCYQFNTGRSVLELQNALYHLDIKKITKDAIYELIFTGLDVTLEDINQALSAHGIQVSYFRDITNSARLLFEQ